MEEGQSTYFVEVILPLHLKGTYTYRLPAEFIPYIEIGQRVVIQFGKRKVYSSIVLEIHQRPPVEYAAKYVLDILDREPLVRGYQLKFWKWMSDYYMCSLGEVMSAALPSGLKLSSESKVVLNEEFSHDGNFETRERQVLEALSIQGELNADQIAIIIGLKSPYLVLKSLLEKQAVCLVEELKPASKPKIEAYISLNKKYHKEKALQTLFDSLEKRAPKQVSALMKYIESSRFLAGEPSPVKKKSLQKEANVTASVINSLVSKSVFVLEEREVGRLADRQAAANKEFALSEAQNRAFNELKSGFQSKNIALLHGVTSSGKTEIYIRLIEEALSRNEQVLYLVPEIALTTQLIQRLQRYFGEQVGVYHSKFSNNERVEIWTNLLAKKLHDHRIIIGARSALFVPFEKLGLVIVDEEHDSSFKQFDPAPRYNARDSAIKLATMLGAKVVLGSATPAVETIQNCIEEKYHHVTLTERFGGVQMPEILVADLKREYKRKTMKSHFSSLLTSHMQEALDNGRQIILFQNRRGYNPLWQCEEDAWTPQCVNCDVSLTYHRNVHRLKCHYCGFSMEPPTTCKACGSKKLNMVGFGTEKIENEIEKIFPKARVKRMDLDTTRRKNALSEIIASFEEREIDILVGTQMVTKGLDFNNVGVVGVMSADTMLNRPDFRAFERAFQMITQVAGRAGRSAKGERGKVVIQTFQPEHWVISNVIINDYERVVNQDLLERRNYAYPPFVRLIKISIKHRDQDLLDAGGKVLSGFLRERYGSRLLGPEYPYIPRVKNLYQKEMLLKIERKAAISVVKKDLQKILDRFSFDKMYRPIRIVIDVDPQ